MLDGPADLDPTFDLRFQPGLRLSHLMRLGNVVVIIVGTVPDL
jgi:hypothetical protein